MPRTSPDQPKPHARSLTRRRILTITGVLALAGLVEGGDQAAGARGIPLKLRRPQLLNKSSGGHLPIGPPPESSFDTVSVYEFGYRSPNARSAPLASFKSPAKFQLSNGTGLQLTSDAHNLSLAPLPTGAGSPSLTPLTKLTEPAGFNGTLRLVVVKSILEDSAVLLAYGRAVDAHDVLLGAWKTPGDFNALDFYSPGSSRVRQFDIHLIGTSTTQVPWVSIALNKSVTGVASALLSNNETPLRAPELKHHGLTEQLAYMRDALDAAFPAPAIGQTING